VVKVQRPPEVPPIEEIDRIAKKHRALFVKLEPFAEPNFELSRLGFELDPNPNLPTKTIVVNLHPTEGELWKNLSQDARQSIRKARNQQLKVDSRRYGAEDFESAQQKFHRLLTETGKRQGFWTGDYSQLRAKTTAFGKDAVIFLALAADQPIAGALVLLAEEMAFYHHAASNQTGQKLFAPYLLTWEIFHYLKNETPIRQLDFEGITDPRFPQTRRWEGFTVFKRKWGGKEVEFPAPHIKYYSPLTKILFRITQL